MQPDRHVDVYRVGILAALHFDLRALRLRRRPTRVAYELRPWLHFARLGYWRPIRNSCNGWHAEHEYAGTRAGHGWTRRRALRDLRRHLDKETNRRA